MANDITGNPWFLDTTGTIYTDKVKIESIVWSDQVAAGDQLLIKDNNGKTILDTKASAANTEQWFGIKGWFNGIVLTTLASGKVMLYMAYK